MNFDLIISSIPTILGGLQLTLELAVISLTAGFVLAVPVALARLSGLKALSLPAYWYIYFFRSTPLLVQLFLIYYGLGQFGKEFRAIGLWWFFREPYWCAILALTLNTGAYTAEIIRGGMLSIPYGQIEAARACGMSRLTRFRRIIWPLAMRQALPAYSNEIILMLHGTALASTITLMEMTGITARIATRTYDYISTFVAVAIIYLIVTLVITRALKYLEWRLTPHLRPRVV